MKLFPSLRVAMRILGICVIAWAALHPAADVSSAAAFASAGAAAASPGAPGT